MPEPEIVRLETVAGFTHDGHQYVVVVDEGEYIVIRTDYTEDELVPLTA